MNMAFSFAKLKQKEEAENIIELIQLSEPENADAIGSIGKIYLEEF